MGFTPVFMKASTVRIGLHDDGEAIEETAATAYECEVRGVTLTPDASVERVKTLCRSGQYSELGTPEWTAEVTYLVGEYGDDEDKVTLSDFLDEHVGEKATLFFRPRAGGRGRSVTITIMPGGYGGEEGSFSEQSVSLPVDGQPVILVKEGGAPAPAAPVVQVEDADVTAGAPA